MTLPGVGGIALDDYFRAVVVLGLGTAVMACPTTVMNSVDEVTRWVGVGEQRGVAQAAAAGAGCVRVAVLPCVSTRRR